MREYVDDSSLRALAADLAGAPERVGRGVTRVLGNKVGPALRREMRIDAAGHKGNWFGKAGTSFVTPTPPVISDELVSPTEVEAGIEPVGSGKLFHIIALGSANNAPAYDHGAALRRVTPLAADELADMAADAVLG